MTGNKPRLIATVALLGGLGLAAPGHAQSTAMPTATTSSAPSAAVMGQVREHMEVVGSDNAHVGTVDKVQGGQIELTRNDPTANPQGQHHAIPADWVASVDGGKVKLNMTAAQAHQRWDATGKPAGDRPTH